jgi:outer membrane lipoprotein-sorting protein
MIGSSILVIFSLRWHPSCRRSAHRGCKLRRHWPMSNTIQIESTACCALSAHPAHRLSSSPALLVGRAETPTPRRRGRSQALRHLSQRLALVRAPRQDHQLRIHKADEEKLYEVSQKGTEKTYVEFLSPREKGQHLLMLGDDMWVYLPDTSRPIRITPLERLSGDASNGDVARTNYAADYTPVYLRTEKAGGEDCYVLNLTAKRKGATYQRILFWVRVQDARPVKAEFHLTSGKLIKSATFDDFMTVGGHPQLRRMTLYDEIRHNSHSVLEYSGIAPRDLPDKLFYQFPLLRCRHRGRDLL